MSLIANNQLDLVNKDFIYVRHERLYDVPYWTQSKAFFYIAKNESYCKIASSYTKYCFFCDEYLIPFKTNTIRLLINKYTYVKPA